MAWMPWLSLHGCIYGGPYLGRVSGLWAGLLVFAWLVDYRTYTESQAALDLAAPRRWRSICRTFGTDAVTWTAALPFVVAEGYRIQNSAF